MNIKILKNSASKKARDIITTLETNYKQHIQLAKKEVQILDAIHSTIVNLENYLNFKE